MPFRIPNCFIAGCQKTGSTWLYRCFKEHPEIYVPEKDSIHYITLNYYQGEEWLRKWFCGVEKEKIICDATPSYVREPQAAGRIYDLNPDSKIIITLRNPIERSFSHYWHQKRTGYFNFKFDDTLGYGGVGNHDIYEIWIKSSFYYDQILPFYKQFPLEHLKINIFDDLVADPKKFIEDIFQFLEVDTKFLPNMVDQRVNKAVTVKSNSQENRFNTGRLISPRYYKGLAKSVYEEAFGKHKNRNTVSEYEKGVSEPFKEKLKIIFKPEVEKLSQLIQKDLNFWLTK